MPTAYTHKRLTELENVAAKAGFTEMEVRFELSRLDAVRIAPGVMRNLEAGSEGMEVLVFGPHHEGDAETVLGWWGD